MAKEESLYTFIISKFGNSYNERNFNGKKVSED